MRYIYHRLDENDFVIESKYSEENIPDWVQGNIVENLIKPKYNKTTNKFYEGATVEEINDIKYQDDLRIETEKYVQRSKDGRLAYAEISAEFRLAKLNGIISEEAHASIEKALIPVRNEVLAGQWISGKNELVLLGSSVIGIDLYNRLLNQIENYISENY